MHQNRFRLGLRPRTRWGSLQRSPNPLAGFKGPTSKKRGGRKRQRREWEGMEGKGMGEKERAEEGPLPCVGMGPRMVNPALAITQPQIVLFH